MMMTMDYFKGRLNFYLDASGKNRAYFLRLTQASIPIIHVICA